MTEPTPGKGRPTPKRREAQGRRRQPVTAPKTRREAARRMRANQRAARVGFRDALRSGDERHLPARDQGPVRRYVRDIVDARRNAGNYLLFVAFGIVLLGLLPSPLLRAIVALCYPLVLLWVIVDAVLLARKVKRKVRERFPEEPTRGLASYAITRSFQMRRLRLPPAKVKIGERV